LIGQKWHDGDSNFLTTGPNSLDATQTDRVIKLLQLLLRGKFDQIFPCKWDDFIDMAGVLIASFKDEEQFTIWVNDNCTMGPLVLNQKTGQPKPRKDFDVLPGLPTDEPIRKDTVRAFLTLIHTAKFIFEQLSVLTGQKVESMTLFRSICCPTDQQTKKLGELLQGLSLARTLPPGNLPMAGAAVQSVVPPVTKPPAPSPTSLTTGSAAAGRSNDLLGAGANLPQGQSSGYVTGCMPGAGGVHLTWDIFCNNDPGAKGADGAGGAKGADDDADEGKTEDESEDSQPDAAHSQLSG